MDQRSDRSKVRCRLPTSPNNTRKDDRPCPQSRHTPETAEPIEPDDLARFEGEGGREARSPSLVMQAVFTRSETDAAARKASFCRRLDALRDSTAREQRQFWSLSCSQWNCAASAFWSAPALWRFRPPRTSKAPEGWRTPRPRRGTSGLWEDAASATRARATTMRFLFFTLFLSLFFSSLRQAQT
jgi:hypothetical protein